MYLFSYVGLGVITFLQWTFCAFFYLDHMIRPQENPENQHKKYHTASVNDVAAIVTSYNRGGDYVGTGLDIGMCRSSVYGIIAKAKKLQHGHGGRLRSFQPGENHGGPRRNKLDRPMCRYLLRLIARRPYLTLQQMCGYIRRRYPQRPRV